MSKGDSSTYLGITPPVLVFHGIDNSLLNPIQQEIIQKLHAGETPLTQLKTFYERQESDSTWRPQD